MSHSAVHPPAQPNAPAVEAKIGPNALIQTVRAVREAYDEAVLLRILRQSGQTNLLDHEPAQMVAESEFAALVAALTDQLGAAAARRVLHRSGELTAAYLLQHRIPAPFQRLLKILPRNPALKLFLFAIGKHAWTFVGSGTFTYHVGTETRLQIVSGIQPAEVVSSFYGGTFEYLLRALIDPCTQVQPESTAAAPQTAKCIYKVSYF